MCMRRVRNVQCTANSFIPFSVHLAGRLAGEVPCLTAIPLTATYVCSNWPLRLPYTSDILHLSLLTYDIKAPCLNVISSESFKSHVIMLPRCFILRVHVRGETFNDATRAGGSLWSLGFRGFLLTQHDLKLSNTLLKGLRMVASALWRSEAHRVVPWSETLHEP